MTFVGNVAIAGGAVYNAGPGGKSSPHFTNVIFRGNRAGAEGGAMANNGDDGGDSSPTLLNVVFYSNTAGTQGGAISGRGVDGQSSPRLINVTFHDNAATNFGGAMYSVANPNIPSRLVLFSAIFWGNRASSGAELYTGNGVTPTVTSSIVQGGIAGAGVGGNPVIDRGGNLDADPLFVDGANGNLRLQSGSPAIDTGSNSVVTATTDLDGEPRIMDGNFNGIPIVDMGAYEFPAYALSLAAVGSGSGQISRNPPGTACTLPCSPAYADGAVVTLTAVPAFGYIFVTWDGACSGAGACVVTMDAPQAVTATFSLKSYALTINTVGSGSVDKSPDQATYLHGTQVTLTPTPAIGFSFTDWSGACIGAGACVVTMFGADSVTAAFTQNSYALTVNTVGSGSVGKSPNAATYLHGTQVTLTPSPATGFSFSGWSGACSGAGACVVTTNAAKSVTATFTQNSYALTVNTVGSGSVGKSPNQATYLHGTQVTLTPTPATGFTFSSWSGACSGAGACVVTMDAAKSVTATFTLIPAQSGSVQGTVVDAEDDPIAGAAVTLSDAAGVVAMADQPPQTTDAAGDYQFNDVPAGPYTLTVSAAGYVTSAPVAVTVQAGQTVSVDTVVLNIVVLEPSDPKLFLPLINRAE